MRRRHFLQSATATLATLGLSQWDVMQWGDRYAQVVAQSTPRKLALLVGINAYPESSNFSALQGCVTDVELQRNLLIYRFGFNPKDILTLTDAQATRQNILAAFEAHLIQQAKAGDVVVFHYSGHGSRVADPDKDTPDGLNSTFVPVDSALPATFPEQGGVVKDIMGHTLFLLMSALKTENVTAVLDSCHSGGGTRNANARGDRLGSLQLRSHRFAREVIQANPLQASPAEFEYQQQWLSRLNLSRDEFIRRRRAGVAKGVVIASTKPEQLAADAPFTDFYAGAFTYTMTQYLWQQAETVSVSNTIRKVASATTNVSSSQQEPIYEIKPGSTYGTQPLYFLEKVIVPAEAVITKVQGNTAEVWLGGLDPQSLVAFENQAILTAVDSKGNRTGQVVLESRQGLVGRGKLIDNAKIGGLLQEKARGIPANLSLKIGLDPTLENVAEAKQQLQKLSRVAPVGLDQGEVHYILGRMTGDYQQTLQQRQVLELPPINSVGLFYPGLDLLPGSFAAPGEAIAAAVLRLQPKFKSLLAARLVKLTLNATSSRLQVSAAMLDAGREVNAQIFEVRGCSRCRSAPTNRATPLELVRLPLKQEVAFAVTNNENQAIYVNVFVIDAAGDMAVIFPNQWVASDEAMKIAPKQTVQIPKAGDTFSFVTQEPKGRTEVLVIASLTPLSSALKAMQTLASRGGQTRGPVALNDPTEVIAGLMADLRSDRSSAPAATEIRQVDTAQIVAMAINFDVI